MISIIIPIYNRLELGLQLIEKLGGQLEEQKRADQTQVICINDGSTEELEFEKDIKNACKKYGFEYYAQKNAGGAATCNRGIKKVKGEYFTFLDCDDDITSEYVKNIFSELGDGEHLIAFRWRFLSSNEVGDWYHRPDVNHNVWSYLFRTDYFSQFKFNEKINIAWDYDYVERSVRSKPDMYIRYAANKINVVYNDLNQQSISKKASRGEITAERGEQ